MLYSCVFMFIYFLLLKSQISNINPGTSPYHIHILHIFCFSPPSRSDAYDARPQGPVAQVHQLGAAVRAAPETDGGVSCVTASDRQSCGTMWNMAHLEVSVHGGSPQKWMVYRGENPSQLEWMIYELVRWAPPFMEFPCNISHWCIKFYVCI